MPDFTADDLRRVLSNRHRFLGLLVEGPMRKPAMESRLGVSRSTVNYSVRELMEFGLVDRTETGFRATQFGLLAHETFERYDSTLEGGIAAFDALAELPPGTLSAPELFEGAEVVLPEAAALDRPLRRYLDLLREADRFQGFLPVVLEPCVDALHTRVVVDRRETELVATPEVLRHLATTYVDRFTDVLGTDRCSIFEAPADLPFGLAIFATAEGRRVGLLIHDDKGVRGLILNDSEAALAWGERTYRQNRESAQHVFTRSPVASR